MDLSFKQKVHNECMAVINKQLNTIENAVQEARETLSSESKSTAGDKHETGRAMAQLEMEKLGMQHQTVLKLKRHLQQLKPEVENKQVLAGSLLETNEPRFYYVSVGLGIITVDGKEIMAVSPASPIVQQMLGKKANETYTFGKASFKINNCL